MIMTGGKKTGLDRFAFRLNWLVERICALLAGIMVLVIWFGVLERYFLKLGMTWTEEFSRYVMIWLALLAVSCGAYYREHIGLALIRLRIPGRAGRALTICLDVVSLAFFVFLTYFGIFMTKDGSDQYATIFGITMIFPFAAVPVSSALTAFQILAALIRDQRSPAEPYPVSGEAP